MYYNIIYIFFYIIVIFFSSHSASLFKFGSRIRRKRDLIFFLLIRCVTLCIYFVFFEESSVDKYYWITLTSENVCEQFCGIASVRQSLYGNFFSHWIFFFNSNRRARLLKLNQNWSRVKKLRSRVCIFRLIHLLTVIRFTLYDERHVSTRACVRACVRVWMTVVRENACIDACSSANGGNILMPDIYKPIITERKRFRLLEDKDNVRAPWS